MGVNDGEVVGAVKIVDNGDASERFNLVLVAEGYRESELDQFESDATHFVNGFFRIAPFDDHSCAFNIWRLDVASDQSGADDPVACGGTGATPNTFFDARFCNNGIRRGLVCNSSLVLNTVSTHVPEFHSAQVIVNSSVYGGTGGTVGVSSTATENLSGVPVDWREILIHEMGHSIFGLADEYPYYAGCGVNEPSQNQHSAVEPYQPNVTISPTATGKWSDLINTSPLPTSTNPDCGNCPPDINPEPADFVVGTYEGAHYTHCGAYRPSYNCKMRKLGEPFCAVCRREIHEYLMPFDPDFCLSRDKIDLSKWVAVATILFGVIQDGGGVIIVGGKPIPIDPWGPMRHSIWAAMANPHDAAPAVRDTIVGLALTHLTSLVSSDDHRKRLETTVQRLVMDAASKLPAQTIR
jgi:hypothetical protein